MLSALSESPARRSELSGAPIYVALVCLLWAASTTRTLLILKIFFLHCQNLPLRREIAIERGMALQALQGLHRHADLEVHLHYLNLLSICSADEIVVRHLIRSVEAATSGHANIFAGLLDLAAQLSSTRTELGLQAMMACMSKLSRLVALDEHLLRNYEA